MKQKLFTLITFSLFFLSIFPLSTTDIVKENFHDIPRLLGTTSHPEVQDQQLGTTNSIQENEWQEGETVKTMYVFPSKYPVSFSGVEFKGKQSTSQGSPYYIDYNETGDVLDVYEQDDVFHAFESDINVSDAVMMSEGASMEYTTYEWVSIVYVIPINDIYLTEVISFNGTTTSGIEWDMSGDNHNTTIQHTITLDIFDFTENAFDSFSESQSEQESTSEGYIASEFDYDVTGTVDAFNIYDNKILVKITYTNMLYLKLWYTFPDEGSRSMIWDFDIRSLSIDQLVINIPDDPHSIESYRRSEYKYSSLDIIIHKLTIECFDYNINITIYVPLNWNYSSIVPSASVSLVSENLYITNTVPLTYEIRFISGSGIMGSDGITSQKQYLAISDKSSDYLEDIGFEGSWSNDWIEDSSNTFTSIELNSTIVSSGAFSLELIDSSSFGLLQTTSLVSGYYYVSFDYYSLNAPDNNYDIYWKYDGSYVVDSLDQTNNRWHSYFGFIHLDDESYGFKFYFRDADETYTVYIDDFAIWKVNHIVETSDWRKIKVSGQMISWDGYNNPSVSSETVYLHTYDRTAETEILSTTKTTDSNGNFEWEIDTSSYSELQDQREIEIRSYSLESWFGCDTFSSDPSEDQDGSVWTTGGFKSFSESFSTDSKWGTYSYQVDALEDSGSDNYVMFIPTSNFDIRESDLMIFWIKSNVSLSGGIDFYIPAPDYDNRWSDSGLFNLGADTWTQSVCFFKETLLGNPDTSDVDFLRIDTDAPATTNIQLNWEIKLIQSQKSYFTPLKATDFPYYYETDPNNNEFDFSEGTLDGWDLVGPASSTEENGYTKMTIDNQYEGLKRYDGFEFASGTLTKTSVRMKANTTVNMMWGFLDESNEWFAFDITTSWQIFEFSPSFTMSSTSDMWIYQEGGYSTHAEIYYDTIRLLDRDTPSISTANSYAWVSSSNNSFMYRTEIDDTLQGYYSDLTSFSTDQTLGSHTINATVYDDSDRNEIVFLPGDSVTSSYTVSTDFSVTVNSFSLSDNYVNIYVTASKDGTYTIYENNSQDSTGSFDKSGTAISHSRDTTAGAYIDLAYKFVNGSDTLWFNTTYSNSAATSFSVEVHSFSTSDSFVNVYITATHDGTYYVYENDSQQATGSFDKDGTFISHSRDTTAGAYIDLAYKFTYSGTDVWFNTTYSNSAATSFQVSVESFSLSDNYVNIYVTSSYDCSYTIYENESSVGSGSIDKDGTAVSHSRNTTYNTYIDLAYKFTYSATDIWFNTTYSNADYTHLIVTISTPILVDGRVSIGVTSNLGDSTVHIDDDSIAGTEVNWENEGVFSWFSNIIGENNITIQVRNDANGDGDYTDSGETWSDTVSYHLYETDLEIVYANLLTFTDEGATFMFMSNHRGAGTTEFRCRITDEVAFSQWLSEDDHNGTYDFTFSIHDLDTTYNFTVEIRNYITDESPGYQYKYLRFEYTPYSPDSIVRNPQPISPQAEEPPIEPEDSTLSMSVNLPQMIFVGVIFILFVGIAVALYSKREEITTAPKKISDSLTHRVFGDEK